MSYFSTDQSDTTQTQTSFLEKLKQEKGDQWSDPETLAKGYVSAQEHIASLERQNKEMLEDLSKRATAEDIVNQLKQSQAKPAVGETTAQSNNNSAEDGDTKAIGAEDIKTLINEALTVRETERTSAQNLAEADKILTERFGTEVDKVVGEKATELGLSKERLTAIASESPTAFLALIGEKPAAEGNVQAKSTVNTAADAFSQDSNARSWDFYQKMRRENPKLYYSPKMQRQLEKDYVEGKVQIPT